MKVKQLEVNNRLFNIILVIEIIDQLIGYLVKVHNTRDCVISLFTLPRLQALYDYQPKISDVQLVAAWTVVMETAHMRLMK